MDKIKVLVKKIHEDAVIPRYAHEDGDVGMDMTAVSMEYDVERDMYVYHTGLAFESDVNVGQFLFLRSSNRNTDAYLCNGVGIADSAIYRGEILFCFKNRTSLDMMTLNNTIRECASDGDFKFFNDCYESTKEQLIENAKQGLYAPYKVGDRIGQMVFLRHPKVELIEVEELHDSSRGTDGFGSSGK